MRIPRRHGLLAFATGRQGIPRHSARLHSIPLHSAIPLHDSTTLWGCALCGGAVAEAGVPCYTSARVDGQGQGGSVGKACARGQKKSGIAAATALPCHAPLSLVPLSTTSTARHHHSRDTPPFRSIVPLHCCIPLHSISSGCVVFHALLCLPLTANAHALLLRSTPQPTPTPLKRLLAVLFRSACRDMNVLKGVFARVEGFLSTTHP